MNIFSKSIIDAGFFFIICTRHFYIYLKLGFSIKTNYIFHTKAKIKSDKEKFSMHIFSKWALDTGLISYYYYFYLCNTFSSLYWNELFEKVPLHFMKRKLVGIHRSLLNSQSYTHCFSRIGAKISSKINVLKMKKIDNFVSNCSTYRVQPFVLEVLVSSFERYRSWKNTISKGYLLPGGDWDPLLKQKLYIDWIFLFQSKILNFPMISFHQIPLSTFMRNFVFHCNVKKFKQFPKFSI